MPLFGRKIPSKRPAPLQTPVDELLSALKGGDRQAALTLKERRDEPGVREGVARLAEQAETLNEAFAELVARLGGRGSREALDRTLSMYVSSPKTFDEDAPSSWTPQATQVAGYVLGLTPDHDVAADFLVRLFRHPTPYVRMYSVWAAATIYSHACQPEFGLGAVRTVAMDRILDGLQIVANEDDDVVRQGDPSSRLSLGIRQGSQCWLGMKRSSAGRTRRIELK